MEEERKTTVWDEEEREWERRKTMLGMKGLRKIEVREREGTQKSEKERRRKQWSETYK